MTNHWQWKRLFATTWDSEDVGSFAFTLAFCLQPGHFFLDVSLTVFGRLIEFGVVEA